MRKPAIAVVGACFVGACAAVLALVLVPARAGAQPAPLTLWNPPGLASPERPAETAPWPPTEAAAREAWAEIAMLEDTRASDLTRILGQLQNNTDESVRWRACRAFARLQDSTAVEFLCDALAGDASPRVRAEAAFALGQIGSRSASRRMQLIAREQHDRTVRARAIEAFGKIGDPTALGFVAGHLTSPDPELSREAAIALWRLNDSTAVTPLLEGVKSRDAWTRAYSAWALERINRPDLTVKPLTRLLADSAVVVRAYAARALGRQRGPSALGPLAEASADGDPRVRTVVVRALGALADSAALPQVLFALRDPDANVRETGAQAAAALRSRDAAPALRTALLDADGGVRLAAARALALLLGPSSLEDLRPLLKDKQRWVRAGVYDALGTAGGDEGKRVLLEAATKRSSPEEKSAIYGALATLHAGNEKNAIKVGLRSPDWLEAASAAGAAGASGDSALVPELVRLYRQNPDPKEPDVTLGVLDALATLGPAALHAEIVRPGTADSVRAVLGHAMATRDARQRSEAQRAARAVLADSAAIAAFEAAHPQPAWQPAALATYRTRLAEEDSTGTIGRLTGALLETSQGTIEWRFDTREAPRTVDNFAKLARRGYFDGGVWHRVVPYFVAQDGDPSGTGSGGPGYAFRCEYNRLRYDSGAVGMALSGKDTGGSQYFITHCPQPHLDGRYTIFAHVVRGQSVVDRLRRGDKIQKVTLLSQ